MFLRAFILLLIIACCSCATIDITPTEVYLNYTKGTTTLANTEVKIFDQSVYNKYPYRSQPPGTPAWARVTFAVINSTTYAGITYQGYVLNTLDAGLHTANIEFESQFEGWSANITISININDVPDTLCAEQFNCSSCWLAYGCSWCTDAGTCMKKANSTCTDGNKYSGRPCPKKCPNDCSGNGRCSYAYGNEGYCNCDTHWQGAACNISYIPCNYCSYGRCNYTIGECDCSNTGKTGTHCQCPVSGCGNGTCTANGCICFEGWYRVYDVCDSQYVRYVPSDDGLTKTQKILIIVFSIFGGLLIIGAVLALVCCCMRCKQKRMEEKKKADEEQKKKQEEQKKKEEEQRRIADETGGAGV